MGWCSITNTFRKFGKTKKYGIGISMENCESIFQVYQY